MILFRVSRGRGRLRAVGVRAPGGGRTGNAGRRFPLRRQAGRVVRVRGGGGPLARRRRARAPPDRQGRGGRGGRRLFGALRGALCEPL